MEPSWHRKFRRAEEHLESLARLICDFLATEPFSAEEQVESRLEPNGSHWIIHSWSGQIKRKPPPEWSPIIGDCLNNLRSSLDHIMWSLAGGRGRRTAFPIFLDEEAYRAVTPDAHLKYVSREIRDFVEVLQPYKHVKGYEAHFLFLLERLTNDDKHRELLGTEIGVAHINVDNPVGPMKQGDLLTFEFERREDWFENGSVFIRYRSSNPDVYVPLRFTFDVAFDPLGSAHALPVLTCLASLMVAVWMILSTIEIRFLRSEIPNHLAPPLEGRAQFIGVD